MRHPSPNVTGRHLGPYALLAKLGEGGMGTVYLGLQRGIGGFEKKVALKCINREAAGDKQFVAMLVDEARLMAQLTHPNIVQVIDLSEHDGLHFVVMEYVEGIDARTLSSTFDLALDEAVHIIAEAARGLAYAHRKAGPDGAPLGIVHRDISGHNLLVSSEGITRVLDFGIAKAASNRHRTEIGVLKGKLAYMSPEQAMGKSLDARSDLFSLGIVLWELCTKRRLFIGDTEIQLLMKVQRCEVEPPSRVVDGFPRQLEDIILKCLAADPNERYADGERLADDLWEFQRTHLGAVAPRAKLAAKVATYLHDHPHEGLDTGEFAGLEKTMAALGAESTIALTRAQSRKAVRNPRQTALRIGLVVATLTLTGAGAFLMLREKPPANLQAAAALQAPPEQSSPVPPKPAPPEAAPPPSPEAAPSLPPKTLPAPQKLAPVVTGEKAPPVVRAAKKQAAHTAAVARKPVPSPAAMIAEPRRPPPLESPPAVVETPTLLSLNAKPWARVYIDGVAISESTPLLKHALKPGKHKVVLVNPELRLRREIEIELKPGEHLRHTISLQ